MHKYQFYISFNDKKNTAASKAVQDCRYILSQAGYQDYTIDVNLSTKKLYLWSIIKSISKFLYVVQPRSIVAVQYPLLSGNGMFKYVIKALRFRKVKFFCIIHDLDELRYNSNADLRAGHEAQNLNFYDCIIVHNNVMQNWLLQSGVNMPMVVLQIFDYLTHKIQPLAKTYNEKQDLKKIVFAGNLIKSNFIYRLSELDDWRFNLYGPNYSQQKGETVKNMQWKGVINPDEIAFKMDGAFGLIWDGEYIDRLDEKFGRYLKYNNPHKLSLYLAAGLPVIAPRESAIGSFIKTYNLGILVNNLSELHHANIDRSYYNTLKLNVMQMNNKLREGQYLQLAINKSENILIK